jgi:autotransporter-associated beta strand protein
MILRFRCVATVGLLLAGLVGLVTPAQAQNNPYTWNTTDGNWNVTDNWRDGLSAPAVPPGGDTTALIFNASGTTSYTATNNLGPFTLNSITVANSGSGMVTLAGDALTLGGTTPTFDVTGAVTVNNVLGGTSLIKTGTGTLTLTGANTYTSGTTISAGTLVLGGDTVASSSTDSFPTGTITSSPLGTGAVTLSGGTLSVAGGNRAVRNTFTVTGTASAIDVGSGLEFTTTNTITGGAATAITKTGAGLWRIADAGTTGSFTGTLTINGGDVLLADPTTPAIGGDFGASAIVVNDGARFTFGTNPAYAGENPDLPNSTFITANTGGTVVWNIGEDFGGVNLFGGQFQLRGNMNLLNATTASELRAGTISAIVGGAPVIGGSAAINKTTAGTVTITGVPLTGGALNIQEGVLSTDAGITGTANLTFGTATTTGTLQYTGASGTIARPVVLNGLGGTIEIADAATTVTASGAVSGSGPLTKTGAGTLALTGALNQTGTTTVAAGTLALNPVVSAGGFSVSSGATMTLASGAGTASLGTPTLAFGGATSTLRFDLNTATVPTAALVNVTGIDGLTPNGAQLQVTNAQAFPTGTFTLIDYAGTGITSGFALQLPGRTAGSLVYDTANTRIDLNITGSDSVVWTGAAGGTWDVGTAPGAGGTNNWKLASNSNATNFIDTDTALFDDSTTNRTVTLNTTARPAAVTVNTAATYTFQGTGAIAGTTGLTKQGTGTAVLATDNTYTGLTTVSAGTLQIGAGGATGSIAGNIAIDATGTLTFDRTGTLSYAGNISNAGTAAGNITKTGAGTVVLLGDNTFTGTVTINGGTLRVADGGLGGDLDAASIVVNTGGRFEFAGPDGNADLPGTTTITINTGGVAEFTEGEDYGAINLRGGAYNTGVNNNLGLTSVLESGTLTGLPAGSLAGAGLIQKTTDGTVTITGVALNGTGGIAIDQGTLSTDSAIETGAGGTDVLTLGTSGAATLQYRGATAAMGKPVTLGEAGGIVDVTQAGTTYTLSGVISGSAITKAGPGTLALTGANNYAGTTTVSAGTLLVNGNQSAATGSVSVAGGTLGGRGTVGGAVTVSPGGKVLAGQGAAVNEQLTLGSSLALGNNTVIRAVIGNGAAGADTTLATGSSQLAVTGAFGRSSATDLITIELVSDGSAFDLSGSTTYTRRVVSSYGGLSNLNAQTYGTADNVFAVTGVGFDIGSWQVLVGQGGSTVDVMFTPVPEPATVLGLGAVGLIRRRRRLRHT